MRGKNELTENIDKLHTTELGIERISRNLKLTTDVVEHCRRLVMDESCRIYKRGKNRYCEASGVRLTVNAHSYTIIMAHPIKHLEKNNGLQTGT